MLAADQKEKDCDCGRSVKCPQRNAQYQAHFLVKSLNSREFGRQRSMRILGSPAATRKFKMKFVLKERKEEPRRIGSASRGDGGLLRVSDTRSFSQKSKRGWGSLGGANEDDTNREADVTRGRWENRKRQ